MANKKPNEIAQECIAFGVRRVARLVNNYYDRHLAPSGLRHTQFTLLNAIQALGPVKVNELAEETQTDRTTLSRNLDVLEKNSFIERSKQSDRRSRMVQVSRQGKRALDKASAAWTDAQKALVGELGRSNYRRLMVELDYLEEALQRV